MIGPKRTVRVTNEEMRDLIQKECLSLKSDLCPQTAKLMEKLETLGPVKLYCELSNGDTYECLAFKGQEKLVCQIKSAENITDFWNLTKRNKV